jgi:NADH-quinone oxidoreductase subunit A
MNLPIQLLDAVPNATANSTYSYLPVVIQLIFAVGLVAFILLISNYLGPKRRTKEKLEPFASGISSHGDARHPIAIKYFLVAILFVLFDVEIIFFYPYAVNLKSLGWAGFWKVLLFVAFFLIGFYYISKKGALKWEN